MLQSYFSHAPWLHFLVAAIAYFALGAIWYMPAVFGKIWGADHKLDMTNMDAAKKRLPMLMIGTFLLNFGLAVATGLLLTLTRTPGKCVPGIKIGLFVSSFIAACTGINYLYTQKTFRVWIIDAGYHVLGITIMSIILSVWHG